MVHALQEAWRVVRFAPNYDFDKPPFRSGVLDIRPQTADPMIFVRLYDGREVHCGTVQYKTNAVALHTKAENYVQLSLQEGWFIMGAERDFEWVDKYDAIDDLIESVEEDWPSRTVDEDVALRLMQVMQDSMPGAQILIRQRIGLRMLQKAHS